MQTLGRRSNGTATEISCLSPLFVSQSFVFISPSRICCVVFISDRVSYRPLHILRCALVGRHALTTGEDGTLRVWRVPADSAALSGTHPEPTQPLATATGHTGSIWSLAVHAHTQPHTQVPSAMLATGGADSSVRLWRLAALLEAQKVCNSNIEIEPRSTDVKADASASSRVVLSFSLPKGSQAQTPAACGKQHKHQRAASPSSAACRKTCPRDDRHRSPHYKADVHTTNVDNMAVESKEDTQGRKHFTQSQKASEVANRGESIRGVVLVAGDCAEHNRLPLLAHVATTKAALHTVADNGTGTEITATTLQR